MLVHSRRWELTGPPSLPNLFLSLSFSPQLQFLIPPFFYLLWTGILSRMLTIRFALVALLTIFGEVQAVPQNRGRKGGNRNGGGNTQAQQTPQQQAAAIPQGISQATDGSMILDMTATVK